MTLMSYLKKYLKLASIILLIIIGFCFFSLNSISKFPYPYKFSKNTVKNSKKEVEHLFLGGDFAAKLAPYISKYLIEKTKDFPMEFGSFKNHGIHRNLHYISEIKKAKTIFYMPNLNESLEVKINLEKSSQYWQELKKIKSPLWKKIYQNSIFSSFFFPTLNTPLKLDQDINKEIKNLSLKDKVEYQIELLKLYSLELKSLIYRAKKTDAKLVFISTPLDIKNFELKSCLKLSKRNQIKKEKLYELLALGEFKKANSIVDSILLKEKHNAEIYFLKALISESQNKELSSIINKDISYNLNCNINAKKPIYNAILKKMALKYNVTFFDLAQESKRDKRNFIKKLKISKKSLISLLQVIKYFTSKY